MKLTHDPHLNVAYIRFQEDRGEVETIRVSDQMNVDISPDGTIYGIELLNANEQLGARVVWENEGKGSASESRIEIYRDLNGDYRVRGRRPNGEAIWTAGPFESKAEAMEAVEDMRTGLPRAELTDLTAA